MGRFGEIDKAALDRYITGNWGEDSMRDEDDGPEAPDEQSPEEVAAEAFRDPVARPCATCGGTGEVAYYAVGMRYPIKCLDCDGDGYTVA